MERSRTASGRCLRINLNLPSSDSLISWLGFDRTNQSPWERNRAGFRWDGFTWGTPPPSILLLSPVTSLQHPSAYCFFLCLSALPPLVQFCTHSPRLHSPPLAPADIQAAFFFPTHTLSLQPIPLITVNESFICNQRASPLAGRVPVLLATPTPGATRGFDTIRLRGRGVLCGSRIKESFLFNARRL